MATDALAPGVTKLSVAVVLTKDLSILHHLNGETLLKIQMFLYVF